MKDHYQALGIAKTANPQEIKRAYFEKVRQYPPERFPEEFKEIRGAYETLSDGKKRAEYDEIGALPESIAPLFWQARNDSSRGKRSSALDTYRLILKRHPELDMVRAEYAWTLRMDGKNGKAMEVWEELCRRTPKNATYAYELASSYEDRGWIKKAVEQYRRALELDGANASCWSSLIGFHARAQEWEEAKKLCRRAIEAVKEKNSGTLFLYAQVFVLCMDDKAVAEDCLKNILPLIRAGLPAIADEAETAVSQLTEALFVGGPGLIHLFPYLQQMADLLPYTGEELTGNLTRAKRFFGIDDLSKKDLPVLFHDLLCLLNTNTHSKEDRLERISMEFVLLDQWNTYHPWVLRLKKEYPELYDLHKDFFDQALGSGNPERMKHHRRKELAKNNVAPLGYVDADEDEDWEPVQTVRRTEAKVGRNDPCPCGSGKKYKRCCGA